MITRKKKEWDLKSYLELLDFDLKNACFEIRTLDLPRISLGFFDDISKACEEIKRYDTFANVYVAPNPRKRENFLVDNKMKLGIEGGKSEDVQKVKWFLIDIDTTKKNCLEKEAMCTDEEIEKSKKVCDTVVDFLKQRNIDPIIAFSGNGWHLMIKTIDYDNSIQESYKVILNFLKNLFHNDFCEVDLKVSDPSRIWKCYYTQARKGKNTIERPYRYAKLIYVPEKIKEIDVIEKFKEILGQQKLTQTLVKQTDMEYALFDATIKEFKKADMYIKDEGHGMHSVKCPWASLHSVDTGIKQTVIYEPNQKNLSLGLGFCCQHGNHSGEGEKKTKDVLAFFKISKRDIEKQQDLIAKKQKIEKYIQVLERNSQSIDPDVENLVREKDFACHGEVIMLFASDGVGKTWAALDIARGFSTNSTFWFNRFTPRKAVKVFYFNADKQRKTFQQKYIYRFFKSLENKENLEFNHKGSFQKECKKSNLEPFDLSLSHPLSQLLFEEYISRKKFKVIIFDSLYASSGDDFNAGEVTKMMKVITYLKSLAENLDVFIIILHHNNKTPTTKFKKIEQSQDSYAGSKQLGAQVSYTFGLERIDTDQNSKIVQIKLTKEGTLSFFKPLEFEIKNIEDNKNPLQNFVELREYDINKVETDKLLERKKLVFDIIKKFLETPSVYWITMEELKRKTNQKCTTSELNECLDALQNDLIVCQPIGKTTRYQLKGETK
jgi:hypothetical protein